MDAYCSQRCKYRLKLAASRHTHNTDVAWELPRWLPNLRSVQEVPDRAFASANKLQNVCLSVRVSLKHFLFEMQWELNENLYTEAYKYSNNRPLFSAVWMFVTEQFYMRSRCKHQSKVLASRHIRNADVSGEFPRWLTNFRSVQDVRDRVFDKLDSSCLSVLVSLKHFLFEMQWELNEHLYT